jgi:diacylglycerol kinase (ATP)
LPPRFPPDNNRRLSPFAQPARERYRAGHRVKKGLLIHNPRAGSHTDGLLPVLTAALPDAEVLAVDEAGDVTARARQAAWVAVAGGDGTVESIAAALIGTDVPLGIIPAGTYNNLARSLGIPSDPAEACEVVQTGRPTPTDVGFANGKPFFECLGSGLDAALYPLGEEIKSGRPDRWIDLLRKAWRYRRQRFQLTLDRPVREALVRGAPNESRLVHLLRRKRSGQILLSALMVVVSNGPYFGMNFHVAPHARPDDGHLTVTVFSRYSKLQLWWHFLSIAHGRREYRPTTVAFCVRKLRISGPRPLPVHLDGHPEKELWPLDIECRKGAIRIFRKA